MAQMMDQTQRLAFYQAENVRLKRQLESNTALITNLRYKLVHPLFQALGAMLPDAILSLCTEFLTVDFCMRCSGIYLKSFGCLNDGCAPEGVTNYKFESTMSLPTYPQQIRCTSENDLEMMAYIDQIATNYTRHTRDYKKGIYEPSANRSFILEFTNFGKEEGFRISITFVQSTYPDHVIFEQDVFKPTPSKALKRAKKLHVLR